MRRYNDYYGSDWNNKGKFAFAVTPLKSTIIKKQVRKIKPVNIKGRNAYVLARNGDSTLVLQAQK